MIEQHQIKTRIAQAKAIAESLAHMKGAAMKAGQLLSLDAGEFLPPEASEFLSRLHGKADPVDFADLEKVLIADLTPAALRQLENLDRTPAASASIGQVHRATLRGESVAVKIQYPGIAESIDSDIDALERLTKVWTVTIRNGIDFTEVFEELRVTLHLEADYAREIEAILEYTQRIAHDPRFVVPRVFPEVSGRRVLVTSWETGTPLGDWIKQGPPKAERVWFAHAILELYCQEFFEWRLVQTDPNPGNFFVRPEKHQIVLLDFGATLRYEESFRNDYVAMLRLIEAGERKSVLEAAFAAGLLDPREDEETRELFMQMIDASCEPFSAKRQPFMFRDPDYDARSRRIGLAFLRQLRFTAPPRKLIFLHRKLGGVFQILRKLDIELDLTPYWQRMMSR